jgi:hypothetical protein
MLGVSARSQGGRKKASAHGPDIELRVIEQREVDLSAHRGNFGLV